MSELFSRSLRDVLQAAASSEPTPGGGSVAAITAAFAASMSAMVANLTIGKKKYKDVEPQVTRLRDKAASLMVRAEELVDADIAGFKKFMECYKMPKGTDEERALRDKMVQEALVAATETPLEIARTALDILKMVLELAPIGNAMAVSDAGVSAYLAEAAVRAALLNVDINLPQVKDPDFSSRVRSERESLVKEAGGLKDKAMSIIFLRMKGS